jgi:hypothetical protein
VRKNRSWFDKLTTNGTVQCEFKYVAVRPEPVEGRSDIFSYDHRARRVFSMMLFPLCCQRLHGKPSKSFVTFVFLVVR